MSPGLRRFVLVIHVIASVGWLGAVIGFLVLAIAGLASPAVYGAMALLAHRAIVPLCLASLVTGVVQALGSPWGLVKHYWVVFKLAITVISTVILFAHLQLIDRLAVNADERGLQIQLIVAPAVAIVALASATVLAIYKPRGRLPAR
jgi:hypothetical protein